VTVGGKKFTVNGLGSCGGCGATIAYVQGRDGTVTLMNVGRDANAFEQHSCGE
jgi:hypothetical protein